mmetsp:Transcript_15260/g.43636  ORF Transcript_15260/g.43636 Transcript_15260/m.43636 type:complete len:223 (+) Transcript_15260:512-1180(+)
MAPPLEKKASRSASDQVQTSGGTSMLGCSLCNSSSRAPNSAAPLVPGHVVPAVAPGACAASASGGGGGGGCCVGGGGGDCVGTSHALKGGPPAAMLFGCPNGTGCPMPAWPRPGCPICPIGPALFRPICPRGPCAMPICPMFGCVMPICPGCPGPICGIPGGPMFWSAPMPSCCAACCCNMFCCAAAAACCKGDCGWTALGGTICCCCNCCCCGMLCGGCMF